MSYKLIRITKMMSEEELKNIVRDLSGWKVEVVLDKGFEIYLILSC